LVKAGLHFANEEGFKGAGRVVPPEAFTVAIPQFEAMLFFAVFVFEVVGLAGVPICERYWATSRHPEEVAFFGLVCA